MLTGRLLASILITLSAEELATTDARKAREAIASRDWEERQSDWLDSHLVEIKKDIGVDPNDVWIYEQEPPSDNDD